ncbi:hypothetical protein CRG98_007801 [Punica granatum]|uniref:Uncharacterized protein n=1 Tax=Punica granatum TaxID=22663 RepID=A0A2I0KTI1_PUNGR|nr:hypothetical protein CRG98_007801 [Punica granatum]
MCSRLGPHAPDRIALLGSVHLPGRRARRSRRDLPVYDLKVKGRLGIRGKSRRRAGELGDSAGLSDRCSSEQARAYGVLESAVGALEHAVGRQMCTEVRAGMRARAFGSQEHAGCGRARRSTGVRWSINRSVACAGV